MKSPKNVPLKETPENKQPGVDIEIKELRQLLLGREQMQIARLTERLDNPEIYVKDVERVLPEAIRLRATRDKAVAKALEPDIEEGLRTSIKKDPKALADTLYPIMGPSIRKAISSAILGMVQSFNQVLERSFSIEGLKWRFEALSTKKSFAEVVLLNALVYQVEQVLLIHRETGLVLQHIVAKDLTTQDPDLVSGMLTAILDFVQDSFDVDNDESLDTLRVGGDRSVWIEQGPRAILAAVIRGTPPLDVRSIFREAIDGIHIQHSSDLLSFEGDVSPFETTRDQLESCLKYQAMEKKSKASPMLLLILCGIIAVLGTWIFFTIQGHQRWTHFVERLRNEPGIVLSSSEKRAGNYYISGLRDPLASEPMGIVLEAKLDLDRVRFHWESYHSLHPEFILKRITDILEPPETVTFKYEDGVLYAWGVASHKWIVETRKIAKVIPGVNQFQADKVIDIEIIINSPNTVTPEFKDGILYAHGSASHQWIVETRKRINTIPGIEHFQEDGLVDTDLRVIAVIKERIEKRPLFFKSNETEISTDQYYALQDLINDIVNLFELVKTVDKAAAIKIIGHSDSSGSEEKNYDISLKRAEKILSILVSYDLKESSFNVVGVGAKAPLREETTEKEKQFNRCVEFRVTVTDNPK